MPEDWEGIKACFESLRFKGVGGCEAHEFFVEGKVDPKDWFICSIFGSTKVNLTGKNCFSSLV